MVVSGCCIVERIGEGVGMVPGGGAGVGGHKSAQTPLMALL